MRRSEQAAEIYRLEQQFWDQVHEGANHLVYRLTYNTFKRTAASAPEQSIAWTFAELKRTNFRLPIANAILAGDADLAERETRWAMRAQLAKKPRSKAPSSRTAKPSPKKKASTS
jgi:DNA-binding FadR family transcriptional regulator